MNILFVVFFFLVSVRALPPAVPPAVPRAALSAGAPSPPCIGSELVRTAQYTQKAAPATPVASTNCPHQRDGLVVFEKLFPSLSTGQEVTIPPGQRVLFGARSMPANVVLRRLRVASGATLVFDDTDLTVNMRELAVDNGAELWMGSRTCPLQSTLHFKFHGTRRDSSLDLDKDTKPSKGLVCRGLCEIHGHAYAPTWTRLTQTARPHQDIVYLQQPVNWALGDFVLVATSAFFDCPDAWAAQYCSGHKHQNEVRRIKAMTMDRANKVYAVQLDRALDYLHYASEEYQTEVALLSRRIKMSGTPSADGFGGHTIAIGSAVAHFRGIEAINMGQLNVMARYPFHLHLMGDAPNSYIEDCSVVKSNFRAYTVHGTSKARLSRNVAYNIQGNAVYLEDGVEEDNRIEQNFIAHVHPIKRPAQRGPTSNLQGGHLFFESSDLIVPADISASPFYAPNAYNEFVGNAASGGWSAFSFPNMAKPMGQFRNVVVPSRRAPENRPTKLFRGNTCHSTGFYWREQGSAIYVGGRLEYRNNRMHYDSGRMRRTAYNNNGALSSMVFEDTKMWAVRHGVAHWGIFAADIVRIEAYDAQQLGMMLGEASIVDGIMSARTRNSAATTQMPMRRIGFEYYDTASKVILSNVDFRNFKAASADAALKYTDFSDEFLPQVINSMRGIRFTNSDDATRIVISYCGKADCPANNPRIALSSAMAHILDFDGSASLRKPGVPAIFGSNQRWWAPWSDCQREGKIYRCDWKANRGVAYVKLSIAAPGFTGCSSSYGRCSGQAAFYRVGEMTHFGRPRSESLSLSPWPGVTGLSNTGWYWRPKYLGENRNAPQVDGAPSSFSWERSVIVRGDFVVLAVRYPPQARFSVQIAGDGMSGGVPQKSKAEVLAPSEKNIAPVSQFRCNGNSLCSNFGSVGPAWHFDGKWLFVRIVAPWCYTGRGYRTCASRSFERDNVTLTDQQKGGYKVSVTCPGCAVQSRAGGVTFWRVPDEIPPVFKTLPNDPIRQSPPAIPPSRLAQMTCTSPPPPPPPLPTTALPTTTTANPTTAPGTWRFDPDFFPSKTSFMNGNLILYWKPLDGGKVRIGVETNLGGGGWVGFGITNQAGGGMLGADIVTGRVVANSIVAEDRWAAKFALPRLDSDQGGTSDIENPWGGVSQGGWMSFAFTRSLSTSDPRDRSFAAPGQATEILLAAGSGMELAYHGSNRIMAKVFFFGDTSEATTAAPRPSPPTTTAAATTTMAPTTAAPTTASSTTCPGLVDAGDACARACISGAAACFNQCRRNHCRGAPSSCKTECYTAVWYAQHRPERPRLRSLASTSSPSSLPLILGGTLGAVAICALLAVVVMLIFRHRGNSSAEDSPYTLMPHEDL